MHIDVLVLGPNGGVPNSPTVPVRCYRGLRQSDARPADARMFEGLFDAHGWPPDWRGGVYPYHHYHSTAHEVLGVAAGHARLLLGGPGGTALEVGPGDALLLPAGTGHCCLEADDAFLVVGAYPAGQRWDIVRGAADAAVLARIRAVPAPARDPVTGEAF